ncbi:MAG: hypothetical protein B6U89_04325, partial [Desulfurococcales archaeon ex4484_58]
LKLADDVDLDKLAELTEGYSGREIVQVIKYVQLNRISKYIDPNNIELVKKLIHGHIDVEPITMKDFKEALKVIKPIGVDMSKYIEWGKE